MHRFFAIERYRFLSRSAAASLVAISLTAATGCFGGPNNYLRSEMANRGPVALSPSNPYLSSNLFVAKEIEHSKVLAGFIRFRGAPDAIEVKRRTMSPLRIHLFYLRDAEFYSLEESSEDWVIRGPEKIPPQLVTSLVNIPIGSVPPPLAVDDEVVRGTRGVQESEYPGNEPSRMPEEDPLLRKKDAAPPAVEQPPKRSASARERQIDRIPSSRNIRDRKSGGSPKPAPSPEVAQPPEPEESQPSGEVSYVEESSSGDIIHRVTFPGESLRTITSWYTGTPDNAARVARINGIQDPNKLNVGQNVRIPRYLLKRTEPLPLSVVTSPPDAPK